LIDFIKLACIYLLVMATIYRSRTTLIISCNAQLGNKSLKVKRLLPLCGSSWNPTRDKSLSKTTSPSSWNPTMPIINKHRYRQAKIVTECTKHLTRNSRTYMSPLDSDEFILSSIRFCKWRETFEMPLLIIWNPGKRWTCDDS
jgi:hypothetical protein